MKNIILNMAGIDNNDELAKLKSCLEEISAIESFRYEPNANLLFITYNSKALSHANLIYSTIENAGFTIK